MADKRGKGPGRSHRAGVTLVQLMEMFPNEVAAERWFEEALWGGGGPVCGCCGGTRAREAKGRRHMSHWCLDCRRYFSVRTGTAIAHSKGTRSANIVPIPLWMIVGGERRGASVGPAHLNPMGSGSAPVEAEERGGVHGTRKLRSARERTPCTGQRRGPSGRTTGV